MITLERRRMLHAEALFAVLSDASLYEFIEEDPPASVEALRAKLARSESGRSPDGSEQWLNWIVRDDAGIVIGYVQATVLPDLDTNIAYMVGHDHWGRGHASQAVRAMLDILDRDIGIGRCFIVAERRNLRSLQLAERLGFVEAPALLCVQREIADGDILMIRVG